MRPRKGPRRGARRARRRSAPTDRRRRPCRLPRAPQGRTAGRLPGSVVSRGSNPPGRLEDRRQHGLPVPLDFTRKPHVDRYESHRGGLKAPSTPPGFTQRRVELVDIGLNLLPASLVDELPPPHAPGVGQAHAGRGQLAPDVVDAFAEHDLYPVGPLAVDHDVQRLPGFRYAYLDLLWVHRILNSPSNRATLLCRYRFGGCFLA